MDYDWGLINRAVLAAALGDALGVPVEFVGRSELAEDPVSEMRGQGTYDQPAGTWSDDTSMILASMDSLAEQAGFEPQDTMRRYLAWYRQGLYTANNETFDIGGTTVRVLRKFEQEPDRPEDQGVRGEEDNGNGSLMRLLPYILYQDFVWQLGRWDDVGASLAQAGQVPLAGRLPDMSPASQELIHRASSLTHAHPRSILACAIYARIGHRLLAAGRKQLELLASAQDPDGQVSDREAIADCVCQALNDCISYYGKLPSFAPEIRFFERMARPSFSALSEDEIKSSGYVVDSLEACVWSLLNSRNVKETITRAVNLGHDTDTVGSLAGGLSALYYPELDVPDAWVKTLKAKRLINHICNKFKLMLANLDQDHQKN